MNLGDLPFPKGGDFQHGEDYTRLWRGLPLMLSDTVVWTMQEERECVDEGILTSEKGREYPHRKAWLQYRSEITGHRKKIRDDYSISVVLMYCPDRIDRISPRPLAESATAENTPEGAPLNPLQREMEIKM